MDMKLNNTLFVLDTETGGLDPNNASLMEIAGVILRGGKVLHKYSAIIKSTDGTYKCNEFARKLHGITDDMANLEGKMPLEIMQDLKAIKDTYFQGSPMTIVAHNAAFDISFVKKMFVDNGEALNSVEDQRELSYDKIFSRNAIDTATMALVLRLQNKLPFDRCSLDNILEFYEVSTPKGSRHSALSDAKQTAKAFLLMFRDLSDTKTKSTKKINKTEDKKYDKGFDDSKNLEKKGGAQR